MKNLRRAVAMALSVIMLCLTAVGVSADVTEGVYISPCKCELEYPITSRFYEGIRAEYNGVNYFHSQHTKWEEIGKELQALSYYWFMNISMGAPEIWPQVYLDKFAVYLENAETLMSPIDPEKSQLRVDEYSWNQRKLTLECSGDYKLRYYLNPYPNERDPLEDWFYLDGRDGYVPVIVITDKETGGPVGLYDLLEHILYPNDMRFDKFVEGGYADYEYQYTEYRSFTVTMPDWFEPEKHGIEVYFRRHYYDEDVPPAEYLDDVPFVGPASEISTEGFTYLPGDVNYNGVVDLSDATAMLKCIAGWDVEIKQELADVTGDGTVDLIDVMSVLKKAAGWN